RGLHALATRYSHRPRDCLATHQNRSAAWRSFPAQRPSLQNGNRIYQFDNGPRHTIDFVPDTFVDVTDEWRPANEWLGRQMAIVRNEKYDPSQQDPAQRAKETLAAYRGATCGARYAEAFRSGNAYPQEIF